MRSNKSRTASSVRSSLLAISALVLAFIAPAAAAHADSLIPGTCSSVQLKVALQPGQLPTQTLAGTLCNPFYWSGSAHSVDVLVHGATYNSSYWNWPIDTVQYSYVDQTLLAGRATFAYDALGSGASSHPASTSMTIDTQAFALHQAITWLQSHDTYTKFDVIGHSFGSITAVAEAAVYHDENLLVLTGYSHAFNPNVIPVEATDLYPANQDPQFANDNLDSGYITTTPGSRAPLFYDTLTADPAIIAYDEAHKDVVSSTFFGSGLAETNAPAAGNIATNVTVPVLEVLGQEDFIFCGAGTPVNCKQPATVKAFDQAYFTHAPSLSVATIPNTGHDLALHVTNPLSFLEINQWLDAH